MSFSTNAPFLHRFIYCVSIRPRLESPARYRWLNCAWSVPKLQGIGYPPSMSSGGQEAANGHR